MSRPGAGVPTVELGILLNGEVGGVFDAGAPVTRSASFCVTNGEVDSGDVVDGADVNGVVTGGLGGVRGGRGGSGGSEPNDELGVKVELGVADGVIGVGFGNGGNGGSGGGLIGGFGITDGVDIGVVGIGAEIGELGMPAFCSSSCICLIETNAAAGLSCCIKTTTSLVARSSTSWLNLPPASETDIISSIDTCINPPPYILKY